ncbi:MAG: hypothetical protein ACR2F6_03685 [Mycobacteriales bacterium]
MSEDEQWFYCLKHQRVEGVDGCKASDRLGPYPTRDAAEHALEGVEQRNEAWDDDPNWKDD